MTTDDMKPEMKQILQGMFKTDDGKLEIKVIEGLLNLPPQQVQYYLDELIKEKLIRRPSGITIGDTRVFYLLTPEGRAYVMENLME